MRDQKNTGTSEMQAFGREVLDLGTRCLSAGKEWLNNRRNEMANHHQNGDHDRYDRNQHDRDHHDRDYNQTRHQDDRNGRLEAAQGGRYRGTDYNDPRADYERAQGGGGGQWQQDQNEAQRRYGRDYSESGGSRGDRMGHGYAGQTYGQSGDERNAGRYGGYASDDASDYGRRQPGSRREAQAQYGQGMMGRGGDFDRSEGMDRSGRDLRYAQGDDGRNAYGRNEYAQRGDMDRYGYGQGSTYGQYGYGEGGMGRGDSDQGGVTLGGGQGQGRQGDAWRQSHRGKGPRNYTRSDERITEDLNEKLAQDDEIDATDITVTVENGEVSLEGTVEQRWMKHRAEDLAERCPGVKDIDNRIRVKHAGTSGDGTSASSSVASNAKSSTATASPSSTAQSTGKSGSSSASNRTNG